MSVVLGLCSECKKKRELHIWSNSALDYVHDNYERICRRCTLVRQVAHARAMAACLAVLELELTRLDDDEAAEARGPEGAAR